MNAPFMKLIAGAAGTIAFEAATASSLCGKATTLTFDMA
jgi:hypothetical protein